MVERLWPVLIALLACGFIAAGCGDDDDDAASETPATTEEAVDDAVQEAEDAAASGDVDSAVQAAVDACKSSISATPGLSGDTVSDLEGLCEEAASGDIEDAQAASVEVCKAIVEDTIPEGAGRDSAISACESALRTPHAVRTRSSASTPPPAHLSVALTAGPAVALRARGRAGRARAAAPRAELLAAVEAALAEAGGWERIGRIAVGVGPGTFTGLRIGDRDRARAGAVARPGAGRASPRWRRWPRASRMPSRAGSGSR